MLKALKEFLGLTGCYRKFIRHYKQIAKPLTDLLKKDYFHWFIIAQKAFDILKEAMSTAPVPTMPNFNISFLSKIYASGVEIGAVLIQGGKLIAFLNKAMDA